jgi:hypothetical protein
MTTTKTIDQSTGQQYINQIKGLIKLSDLSKHIPNLPLLKDGSQKCPFCQRKNKLSVYGNGEYYKCFHPDCGKKGDIFNFLIHTNKASNFKEAIALIKPLIYPSQQRFINYQQRSSIIDRALDFYESALDDASLEFLNKRGYSKILELFKFGFAPNKFFLQDCGLTKKELAVAGLLNKDQTGEYYDSRIIFPIRDWGSKLVHLQGRAINQDVTPRWMSTTSRYAEGGEDIPQIDNFLFNMDKVIKSTESYVLLTEGISDGLTLLELDSNLPVVSCFGVNIDLVRFSSLFSTKSDLVVLLDNDKYALGVQHEGQYKSWREMIGKLTALKLIIPHLNIWCVPPPELPGVKDINDWYLAKNFSKEEFTSYIDDNLVSLEDFTLTHFGRYWDKQSVITSLLNINKDPKHLSIYNDIINALAESPVEYILRYTSEI